MLIKKAIILYILNEYILYEQCLCHKESDVFYTILFRNTDQVMLTLSFANEAYVIWSKRESRKFDWLNYNTEFVDSHVTPVWYLDIQTWSTFYLIRNYLTFFFFLNDTGVHLWINQKYIWRRIMRLGISSDTCAQRKLRPDCRLAWFLELFAVRAKKYLVHWTCILFEYLWQVCWYKGIYIFMRHGLY